MDVARRTIAQGVVGVLIAVAVVFPAMPVFAVGLAISEVTIDLAGLTASGSDGLLVNQILPGPAGFLANSFARTTLGGSHIDQKIFGRDADWPNTEAASSYFAENGYGIADAETSRLVLRSRAEAATVIDEWGIHRAFGEATAIPTPPLLILGSGRGALTVSIPYTLSVFASATQLDPAEPLYDVTIATASLHFNVNGNSTLDSISVAGNGQVTEIET